jgi:acyl-CoA thioester hydrolase
VTERWKSLLTTCGQALDRGLMSARPVPARRTDFPFGLMLQTRWMDQDPYGHVNNVQYYSFFDTLVNRVLIEGGWLDIARSPVIGLVVETQCTYFASLTYPQDVDARLRVARIGGSSVTYEIGLFRADLETAAAQGRFVHVYVDRATQKPVPLPDSLRRLLAPLLVPA